MRLQILCVIVFICGVSCINQNIFRKYLELRHQRLLERRHKNSESKENNVFDDDEVVTINCGEGEVISVENANYGSPGKPHKPRKGSKGSKGGKSKKDQCSDPQSLAKVKGACNGKQTCEFTVSDLFNEDDCINGEELLARSGSKSSNAIQLWFGYQCKPNPCLSFYCAHEGTCELANFIDLTPQCNCMGDWTGDHCDDDPCKTDPKPCPEKSTCSIKSDGSASCCCDEEYTGDQCDILVDGCTVNPCKNEGSCTLNYDRLAMCNCASPWVGPVCQYDSSGYGGGVIVAVPGAGGPGGLSNTGGGASGIGVVPGTGGGAGKRRKSLGIKH
ncbi:neurogenic locus notch homolog protein 1-like [Mytilus trossulus]|uniref:neurogenic locus notch homolog protein 1-like n=1 Tax=Mytilus trossulus TaxID=6551 RepID=UPI0030060B18